MSDLSVVKMTGGRRVSIKLEEWPILTSGYSKFHDGISEAQATRIMSAAIRARKHADGRVIIYGVADDELPHWQDDSNEWHAGVMLEPGDDVVAGIKRVREDLIDALDELDESGYEDLVSIIKEAARECIQSLQPVKV